MSSERLEVTLEGETMTKRITLVLLLLGCAVAFTQGKKAAATDPWAGTWKLDTAKSKFHNPGPKEETLTVTAATDASVKYSMKGTDPAGAPYTESYDGKADGNPYPLIRNGQEVAKISYHRDSDHHSTGKATVVDGSTFTEEGTVSKDGKTITVTQHHKTKDGNYDDVIVFTRQ
jgi:hypothetical protein